MARTSACMSRSLVLEEEEEEEELTSALNLVPSPNDMTRRMPEVSSCARMVETQRCVEEGGKWERERVATLSANEQVEVRGFSESRDIDRQ